MATESHASRAQVVRLYLPLWAGANTMVLRLPG